MRGDTTDTDDDGTAFQCILKTRPFAFNEGNAVRIGTPWLIAEVASGVTLTVSYILDFGRITKTGTVSLTAVGSETHKIIRLEGLEAGEMAQFIEFQIGDASAVSNVWNVSRLYVPVMKEDLGP